jgi:hypothetical protein
MLEFELSFLDNEHNDRAGDEGEGQSDQENSNEPVSGVIKGGEPLSQQ